jgi:Flp pilus assembly protein TadD
METKPETYVLEPYGVEVREWSVGAFTGQFPTIIVVAIGAVVGGMLKQIGADMWHEIQDRIKKRVRQLDEARRKAEAGHRVLTVFFVLREGSVPIVYYAHPKDGEVHLDCDKATLLQIDDEIAVLVRAGLVNAKQFLGVNLASAGNGPYLRFFEEIPSEASVPFEEAEFDAKKSGQVHELVGIWFDELGMLNAARRHYELAVQGAPGHAQTYINLGITFAREGRFQEAVKHWQSAAKLDGKYDVLHYNIACLHASRGDVPAAAAELRRAVEHGFRRAGELVRDPEFAAIIDEPEIQQIVDQIRRLLRGNATY